MSTVKAVNRLISIGGESPTNGAATIIETNMPYVVRVTIKGVIDLIMHRWNNEAVLSKANEKKGSIGKKTDDLESYVYRNDKNQICLPGLYLRGAIVGAAKFRQDPRSPRKSAADLYKAGVVALTMLAPIGPKPTEKWDYENRERVIIQRNAITRVRPAFKPGWEAVLDLQVLVPEYIDEAGLLETVVRAGQLIGVGDHRPSYGRFQVTRFERLTQPV